MRILVVGMGSIGQRHARNLIETVSVEVSAYRSEGRPLADEALARQVKTFDDLDEALATGFDAVVVANPTSLHMPTAIKAAHADCHLFIEKPLADSLEGVGELAAVAAERDLTIMVGCQFRFHPGLLKLKETLTAGGIGRPLGARAEWGEYLPGWHPSEDYRQGYSARKDLGGGVVLTLIHTLDYMYWLFGEVQGFKSIVGRFGPLEMDVEDTAEILLQFKSRVLASVRMDYLQRPPSHHVEVYGEDGRMRWDYYQNSLKIQTADEPEWRALVASAPFDRNELFTSEMDQFVGCVKGTEQPDCGLDEGIYALRLALAVKAASSLDAFE